MSTVSGVVRFQIILLIVGCHQLHFSIQACPVVRHRQVDRRLKVNTGGFWHIRVGIHEMHGLAVDTSIKRADIILVPVDVKLRFSPVGAGVLAAEHLELTGGHGGVKVFHRVACAKDLRGVTVGTGTVFCCKVVEIVRIADFGIVDVKAPYLIHYPTMLPVVQPAVAITLGGVLVFKDFIRWQIVQLHQTFTRVRQITELVFPHDVAALMDIVRRDRGVHVGRDVPVVRQVEFEIVVGAVLSVRDQEA